jgi:hypothetical protein
MRLPAAAAAAAAVRKGRAQEEKYGEMPWHCVSMLLACAPCQVEILKKYQHNSYTN